MLSRSLVYVIGEQSTATAPARARGRDAIGLEFQDRFCYSCETVVLRRAPRRVEARRGRLAAHLLHLITQFSSAQFRSVQLSLAQLNITIT